MAGMLEVYGNEELRRIGGRLDLASPGSGDELRLIVYGATVFGIPAGRIEVGRPGGTSRTEFTFSIPFNDGYQCARSLEVMQSHLDEHGASLPFDIDRRDPSATISGRLRERMLALP